MTDAALIAATCPGFGNPLALPVDIFDALLRRVGFVAAAVHGRLTDRDLVELETLRHADD